MTLISWSAPSWKDNRPAMSSEQPSPTPREYLGGRRHSNEAASGTLRVLACVKCGERHTVDVAAALADSATGPLPKKLRLLNGGGHAEILMEEGRYDELAREAAMIGIGVVGSATGQPGGGAWQQGYEQAMRDRDEHEKESATGPLPATDDPEGQAAAFRAFGEQVSEIGLREIAEDRSLNADEVQAVAFCARNLLHWCGSATGPLDVELLARAFVAVGLDLDGLTPAEGREAVERLASEYARLASPSSGPAEPIDA